MKKIVVGIMATALVLSVGPVSVFASCSSHNRHHVEVEHKESCEHYNTSCQFVDADGDGICDDCGSHECRSKKCSDYVDADGDGVCDNHAAGKKHRQSGGGSQRHHGGGRV